jgi:hypothetical protein
MSNLPFKLDLAEVPAEELSPLGKELLCLNAQRHFHDADAPGVGQRGGSARMLRIGSMNMLLHGVENPDIRCKDSLAQMGSGPGEADEEKCSLVLANPPFAGSLEYELTAKDLLRIVKTKKTELLFLALFLRLLQTGGRAAVIVNDYDLSINRCKEVEYDPPGVVLDRLATLEAEIARGRKELEALLG